MPAHGNAPGGYPANSRMASQDHQRTFAKRPNVSTKQKFRPTLPWRCHREFTIATSLLGRRASDGGERIGFQHYDAAALEPNPIAVFPAAQLLVGALARHPDHLPDLALGDRDPARLGNLGLLGQL